MMNATGYLPLKLTQADLSKVEILYGYYSAKTGAGKQEITMTGSGKVKLFFSRSRDDAKPEVREGQMPANVIVRLLDVLEEEAFLSLDDHYPPSGHPHARRIIRLTLPDRTKTVAVDAPVCPEFERVAGAVKLATGIALPEALNHRFFPNL